MKTSNTSSRLREIMAQKNLRQVDILEAAKPFCDKYGVKLAKNDLSQYVNGKVEPGQEKLTILGLALNVSEAWLMGYNVDPSRDATADPQSQEKAPTENSERTKKRDINILRIAGRDGSYHERALTDDQLAALKAILDQMPDASEDL